MDEETIKELRAKKKKNLDLVNEYKRKLKKDLELECISRGGHFWWPSQNVWRPTVCDYGHYVLERQCSACGAIEVLE